MEREHNENIQIKLISDEQKIKEIELDWKRLQCHPNNDLEYYKQNICQRSITRNPYILCIEKGEDTQAIVIGRVEKIHVPLRIGYRIVFNPVARSLTIGYGGIMGELDDDAVALLISTLKRGLKEFNADIVYINGLNLNSVVYNQCAKMMGRFRIDPIKKVYPHWIVELPENYNELYMRENQKRRHELRRYLRAIEKNHKQVRVIKYEKEHDLDILNMDVEEISKRTYHRGLGTGFTLSDEVKNRLRLFAKFGKLCAYVLYIDEKPCAYWIGTIYQETCYLDYTGYDPEFSRDEPGTVLFLRMIEDLCARKIRRLDYGLDDALYKQRFGATCWEEASFFIYAPTFRGLKMYFLKTITTLINNGLLKLLQYLKYDRVIKKVWRRYYIRKQEA